MSTEVSNESGYAVEESEFAALGAFVLEEMHVHPQAELEVRFVDEKVMGELNEQWLDEPGPTDVLAFPIDEMTPGTPDAPTGEGMLGAVVLCPQVAAEQARDAGHSAAEEMLLLATHGILHLLGYDHAEETAEKEMFALQRRLLLTFLATRPGAPEHTR